MTRLLLFVATLFFASQVCAFSLFGGKWLLKIDGKKYTAEDFKKWWRYWGEGEAVLDNSTLEQFVDWLLLSREGELLGLYNEPSYKKKLSVFLKVRSLLQLRSDEVGSRIKVDRESLWKLYKERYAPLVKVKILVTDNRTEAESWRSKIKSPGDFESFFKQLVSQKKAKDMGWRRPISTPEDLRDIVFKAEKGAILGPLRHGKTWMIVYIEDVVEPNEADFRKIHRILAERYGKEQEAKFTAELVERLKKKYRVEIRWDLLNRVGLGDLPEGMDNQTVMVIDNVTVTAGQFHEILKREAGLRLRKSKNREELERLKRYIVNSMVSQTLIDKEALGRHYERGPLKDIYWFYKKNRLIKELYDKIIKPSIKVYDEEVKEYYRKHREDFAVPEMVEIAVIQTKDEELIKSVYDRLSKGEDFFDVAKDVMFHGAKPRKFFLKDLVPPVREAVEKMVPGDISNIIKYKDWYFVVKLVKRYPKRVHSFDEVKDSIKKMLFEKKFEEAKREYLSKVRGKVKVEINRKEWDRLVKELRGEG